MGMWTVEKAASSHSPPPRHSLLVHSAAAKIGCGTCVHTAFWAWRLHFMKNLIKRFRLSLDKAF